MDTPDAFRAALTAVAAAKRDAWVDLLFGLDGVDSDEDASLPRGCVAYLPAPVEKLIEVAEYVHPSDVFVDIGSGVGRAVVFMHLFTGATAIGLEIQPSLVQASRALCGRIGANVTIIESDATLAETTGTVFFLYCPFSVQRLARVINELEVIAKERPIRICCLDLPLPALPWLTLAAQPSPGLEIYVSRRVTS